MKYFRCSVKRIVINSTLEIYNITPAQTWLHVYYKNSKNPYQTLISNEALGQITKLSAEVIDGIQRFSLFGD